MGRGFPDLIALLIGGFRISKIASINFLIMELLALTVQLLLKTFLNQSNLIFLDS